MNLAKLLAFVLLLSSFVPSARAAEITELTTSDKTKTTILYLKLKNVRPSLLASLLDSVSNFIPQPKPDENQIQPRANHFLLPAGIEQVIAIEEQSALLVRGTKEGVEKIKPLIEMLDQPNQFVEIEAQFIDISADNLKDFGIDFQPIPVPLVINPELAPKSKIEKSEFAAGLVRHDFQKTLTAVLRNNRAKVVNAPRVTAFNTFPAMLSAEVS